MAQIEDVRYKINKRERLPCVFILDGSGSMAESGAIHDLNDGLKLLEAEMKADDDVADSVEIAVLRMGDDDQVEVLSQFVDAANFNAPLVQGSGKTPLGKAVDLAMYLVEEQKSKYKANGIGYKRPWIFVMSDGEPTDDWEEVADRARAAQADVREARKFILWAIAIGPQANLDTLSRFCVGERSFRLGEGKFKQMFEFLKNSMSVAATKSAGQQVLLPPPPPGTFHVDL